MQSGCRRAAAAATAWSRLTSAALVVVAAWVAGAWLTACAEPPAAQPILDPHALYETRCARCHAPHGADFARNELKVADGHLVGAQAGRALATLLANHRGTTLTDAELKALVEHFAAILPTGWLYQDKCLACHDRAVSLARRQLALAEGRLVGRYSGRDIAAFLQGHGRLSPDQQQVILTMLRRQLDTRPD